MTSSSLSDYSDEVHGLVLKITIFETDECISPLEIRETFRHRADMLVQRNTNVVERKEHQMFEPGRPSGLKDFITIGTERRILHFYEHARVDGMYKREFEIGVKVDEEFAGRDDFLVQRSIAVHTDPAFANQRPKVALGDVEMPLRKIAETYARDNSKHAEEDVRKRTHLFTDGLIRLDYHYGEASITASDVLVDLRFKLEARDMGDPVDASRGSANRVDPNWPKLTPGQERDQLHELRHIEKELIVDVREREKEMAELVSSLERERHGVQLIKDIYDVAYEQSKQVDSQGDKEEDEKDQRGQEDFLSPFLAQYGSGKPLTKHQAQQIKEECLGQLKERLLERANIIQAHLDEEQNQLHVRQTMFKRQTGSGAVEADEEFAQYYEESLFRIEILRQRLARHETIALKKYVEMDVSLNADPRLAGAVH